MKTISSFRNNSKCEKISRRGFMAGAALAVLGTRNLSALSPNSAAELEVLKEFDYSQVALTGGPLKDHYDRIRASYLALENDRLLRVYREGAGMQAPGKPMGGWYGADGFVPGHSLGQYISGLARIGRATGDSACNEKVQALVSGFAETMGAKDRVFAAPNAASVWPCYVLDKHLAGLLDACELCGMEQGRELLPRVFRGALPFIPEFGRDREGKSMPPYDETYVLPENLFHASAITGDHAMRERAIAYLLNREFFDPLARGADVLPGRHAYSHAIALSSAASARLALGEESYLRAIKNAWQLLTTTQQYASGGWGPNETFIEPHKGQLFESLHTTANHFETPCGSYAAIKLARYLLRATGDAQYGDGLERVLYNGLLAAKDPDGEGDYFYYSTFSTKARKVYYPKRWPCCSGTLVQGVADYVKNIFFMRKDGVAVDMYAPSHLRCEIENSKITLTQSTDYPSGQSVTFQVGCLPTSTFVVALRIPGWLDERPSVRVNGKHVQALVKNGFLELSRAWKNGDTIGLDLPFTFRSEPIDDLHPGTVALMRGPLMLVELDAEGNSARLPDVDSLKPVIDSEGSWSAHKGSINRVFAPFYEVRDQVYTTYFESK